MLIKRFKQDEVEVKGQNENQKGLFEIFFNGECVYSKVVKSFDHHFPRSMKHIFHFLIRTNLFSEKIQSVS